jgi:ATP-dependent protease ClpP protease subunit
MSYDEDETASSGDVKKFFEISSKPSTSYTHTIRIDQGITMCDNLASLLSILRNASPKDTVYMYLNCGGGRLDTTLSILHAMKDCKAKIITVADGKVMSAATFLFLEGDEYIFKEYSYFMFHQYSAGTSGKGGEMKSKVDFTYNHYDKFFRQYYGSLFTKKDISKILDGSDKYLNADEVKKLLEKRKK